MLQMLLYVTIIITRPEARLYYLCTSNIYVIFFSVLFAVNRDWKRVFKTDFSTKK